LEELANYKSGKESTEQFPDLLLSSLDKLYEDKQQQLWLISGIHNSIEKSNSKKCPSVDSARECFGDITASVDDNYCDNSEEEDEGVPMLSTFDAKEENVSNRKNAPMLTLELKKAYEFSPSSSTWNIPNVQSWTPTTPTPGSALRPSLSLHNLASKTFTEVLVPSINPPDTYQVTPTNSESPNSPLLISSSPSLPKKLSVVYFGNYPQLSSTCDKKSHIQRKFCPKSGLKISA